MNKLLIIAAVIVTLPLTYAGVHLALIEVGQEIIILHKWQPEPPPTRARLWIVDDGDHTWLHHGYPDSPWIRHLEVDPTLEIERDETLRSYRGTPDPAADPKVHKLLREKYGFADRLVRFWAGSATEAGLLTGTTCTALPVRLEPL
jgi:hypothetical protein